MNGIEGEIETKKWHYCWILRTKPYQKSYLGVPCLQSHRKDELRWKAPQPMENWKGVKRQRNSDPGVQARFLEIWISSQME